MINLLPPDIKQSQRYAHYNVGLLRWVIASGIAFLVIGLIGGYGWFSVHRAADDTSNEISSIQDGLQRAKLPQTNARVKEISNSLTLAQNVLSQEILFSQLLKQMATALPNDTYLTGLNISDIAGGSALDVSANAANYEAATQVQLNLADPKNQIFARADIQNITCDSSNAQDPEHPCKISLRAQFNSDNQFLFINQKKAKS